jgi:hypothetical protein
MCSVLDSWAYKQVAGMDAKASIANARIIIVAFSGMAHVSDMDVALRHCTSGLL